MCSSDLFAKTIAFADDVYTPTYEDLEFSATAIKDEASLQGKGGLLLGTADEEAIFVLGTDSADGANAAAFKYVGVVNDSTTEAYTDEDFKVTTVYTLSVLASDDIQADGTVNGYVAATENAVGALNSFKVKA